MRFTIMVALLLSIMHIKATQSNSPFKIAIIGLGSRSQELLLDCFKFNQNIQVVAACDDFAQESHAFFKQNLIREKHPYVDTFQKSFSGVTFYNDTEQELQKLFSCHQDVDAVFITSANSHHVRHLKAVQKYCSCKNVYMEKPLFKTLDEFVNFKWQGDSDVLIGLTLRYSTMAKIVATQLKAFKDQLGTLQKVRVWENVKFCQGLANFMMSWRRHISLSGGFLLEKCVHDLDLAFFFMDALGIDPQEIMIATKASHELYKKDQKERILQEMIHNQALQNSFIDRHYAGFQRHIPFSFDTRGVVDWRAVLDDIFLDFPQDNNFETADIIPDTQQIRATIRPLDGNSIDFQLDVTMARFLPNTQRGMTLTFEQGIVAIDVIQSVMKITLHIGNEYVFDLQTLNSDHADGDEYIARAILGVPDPDQYIATFKDPIVQFANMLALVSEKQALLHDASAWLIKRSGDAWFLVL